MKLKSHRFHEKMLRGNWDEDSKEISVVPEGIHDYNLFYLFSYNLLGPGAIAKCFPS
jgi:hypothetical protein